MHAHSDAEHSPAQRANNNRICQSATLLVVADVSSPEHWQNSQSYPVLLLSEFYREHRTTTVTQFLHSVPAHAVSPPSCGQTLGIW